MSLKNRISADCICGAPAKASIKSGKSGIAFCA